MLNCSEYETMVSFLDAVANDNDEFRYEIETKLPKHMIDSLSYDNSVYCIGYTICGDITIIRFFLDSKIALKFMAEHYGQILTYFEVGLNDHFKPFYKNYL